MKNSETGVLRKSLQRWASDPKSMTRLGVGQEENSRTAESDEFGIQDNEED